MTNFSLLYLALILLNSIILMRMSSESRWGWAVLAMVMIFVCAVLLGLNAYQLGKYGVKR